MTSTNRIFPYFSNQVSITLFNTAGVLRIFAGLFLLGQAIKGIPTHNQNPTRNIGLLGFCFLQALECIGRIPYVWDKYWARYQLYVMTTIYFIVSGIYFYPIFKKYINKNAKKENYQNLL